MSNFKREHRYIVIKQTDVQHLSTNDWGCLIRVINRLEDIRESSGKPPLCAVVVESDWPEYEPVWRMIEARVTGKATSEQE